MHAVEAIYRKARNVSLQLASDEVFSFVQSRGKGEEVKDNAAIEVRKSNSSPDPRHPAPHFAAAPPRQQSALTDQPVAEDAEEELEEGRLEFDYEKLAAEAPTGPLFEFPEDEIELKRLSRQQEFPLHPHLHDTGQEAAVDAGEAAYIADLVQFFTEDWWFLQRKHDPSPPLPVPPPPDPDSLRDEYEGLPEAARPSPIGPSNALAANGAVPDREQEQLRAWRTVRKSAPAEMQPCVDLDADTTVRTDLDQPPAPPPPPPRPDTHSYKRHKDKDKTRGKERERDRESGKRAKGKEREAYAKKKRLSTRLTEALPAAPEEPDPNPRRRSGSLPPATNARPRVETLLNLPQRRQLQQQPSGRTGGQTEADSEADLPRPELLEYQRGRTERENAARRRQRRIDPLSVWAPAYATPPPLLPPRPDPRELEALLVGARAENRAERLLEVELLGLEFAAEEVTRLEPLWVTLTLFDVERRCRAAESVMLESCHADARYLLPPRFVLERTEGSPPSRLLLRIPPAVHEAALVVRVERVLQVDLHGVEHYQHPERVRDWESVRKMVSSACARRFALREPVFWGWLRLEEAAYDGGEMRLEPLWRLRGSQFSDAALLPALDQRSASLRKAMLVPGACLLCLRNLDDVPATRLSPCLLPPADASSASTQQDVPLCWELQDLSAARTPRPCAEYRNLLFVYPESVTLAGHAAAGLSESARLAIRIELRAAAALEQQSPHVPRLRLEESSSHSDLQQQHQQQQGQQQERSRVRYQTLRAVQSRYSATLASACMSAAVPARRSKTKEGAQFYDEFKLHLPRRLRPDHHLLFSLVRFQPLSTAGTAADGGGGSEGHADEVQVIAHAVLPLYQQELLPAPEVLLPLFAAGDLSGDYLHEPLRLLEGGRAQLRVRLLVVSSLYTQEQALARLLPSFYGPSSSPPGASPQELVRCTALLQLLRAVPASATIRFLGCILPQLVRLIAGAPTAALRQQALLSLGAILRSQQEVSPEAPRWFAAWIELALAPAHCRQGPRWLHEELVRAWTGILLAPERPEEAPREDVPFSLLRLAPLLLRILFKAMLFHCRVPDQADQRETTAVPTPAATSPRRVTSRGRASEYGVPSPRSARARVHHPSAGDGGNDNHDKVGSSPSDRRDASGRRLSEFEETQARAERLAASTGTRQPSHTASGARDRRVDPAASASPAVLHLRRRDDSLPAVPRRPADPLPGAGGRARLPPAFLLELRRLLVRLAQDVRRCLHTALTASKDLGRQLCVFLRDLLHLGALDRGLVCRWLQRVLEAWSGEEEGAGEALAELRADLLRLLVEDRAYTALCLPVAPHLAQLVSRSALAAQWRAHHLPAYLLCEAVAEQLLPWSERAERSSGPLRQRFASVLTQAILRQTRDVRYQSSAQRAFIAGTYFPLLISVLDAGPERLREARAGDLELRRSLLACVAWLLKHLGTELLRQWWRRESHARLACFFALLRLLAGDFFAYEGPGGLPLRLARERDEVHLASVAADRSADAKHALEQIYGEVHAKRTRHRYRSLRSRLAGNKIALAAAGTGAGSPQARHRSLALTNLVAGTGTGGGSDGGGGGGSSGGGPGESEQPDLWERALSAEVALIVLDQLEAFAASEASPLATVQAADPGAAAQLLREVLRTLLCLQTRPHQPRRVLTCLYASLRAFVQRHAALILDDPRAADADGGTGSLLAQLLEEAVRHCSYACQETRQEATALVYLLLRRAAAAGAHGDAAGGEQLARVRSALTVGVSKLVSRGLADERPIRRALEALANLAAREPEPPSAEFAVQVRELTWSLGTILQDSSRIKEWSADAHMVADLLLRIAAGYRGVAEMRLAWLESLASFHASAEPPRWAEAAQCHLHVAALLALALDGPPLPPAFATVSPNLRLEEELGAARAAAPGGQREGSAQVFTEARLVRALEEAIRLLEHAQLHETAADVYKLLLPIYEARRQFDRLRDAHGRLRDLWDRVLTLNAQNTRRLASYYRVGFYGAAFEDLDGQEFVYKEPPLTKLGEIKQRLERALEPRLGSARLAFVTDSGPVDRAALRPDLAYLQITALEPFHSPEERQRRLLYYERNTHLNQFIFETPFTLDGGRAQAARISEQWKRKTILRTALEFPCMATRLPVVGREEIAVSPLENAVEALQARQAALLAEVKVVPPSFKRLHALLQGTVRLQVHAGPQEIARAFLSPVAPSSSPSPTPSPPPSSASLDPAAAPALPPASSVGGVEYSAEQYARLREALRSLLETCGQALEVSRALIGPEQLAFHRELVNGYRELEHLLASLGVPVPPEPPALDVPPVSEQQELPASSGEPA